jgi:predicted histidine transporter YuiF (NhaC family)
MMTLDRNVLMSIGRPIRYVKVVLSIGFGAVLSGFMRFFQNSNILRFYFNQIFCGIEIALVYAVLLSLSFSSSFKGGDWESNINLFF